MGRNLLSTSPDGTRKRNSLICICVQFFPAGPPIPITAPPLNLHISRGGIYRKKTDAPKHRLTQAEREIRTLQLAEEMKLANEGDDAMLRTMTDIRFAVECVVDAGGIMNNKSPIAQYDRRRKFSNPLFLSSAGLIECYPENDEDLFTSEELAVVMSTHAQGDVIE